MATGLRNSGVSRAAGDAEYRARCGELRCRQWPCVREPPMPCWQFHRSAALRRSEFEGQHSRRSSSAIALDQDGSGVNRATIHEKVESRHLRSLRRHKFSPGPVRFSSRQLWVAGCKAAFLARKKEWRLSFGSTGNQYLGRRCLGRRGLPSIWSRMRAGSPTALKPGSAALQLRLSRALTTILKPGRPRTIKVSIAAADIITMASQLTGCIPKCQAPLASDRRRHERLRTSLPIRIVSVDDCPTSYPGVCRNLSRGGVQFETDARLQMGQVVELEIVHLADEAVRYSIKLLSRQGQRYTGCYVNVREDDS